MKIAIEARMIGPGNTRGLGRYIEELVKKMSVTAPEHTFVLITKKHILNLESYSNIQTVIADIPWYGWREQIYLPKIIKNIGADVVHIPHWNVPLFYNGPLIVTIHDLLLKHFPTSAKSSTRSWPMRTIKKMGYKMVLDHAVKTAKAICVPTQFTKQDLLSFYPESNNKIIVTGEGIEHLLKFDSNKNLSDIGAIDRNEAFIDAKKDFLLYVGSAYPHKRLDLLLAGWKELMGLYPKTELLIAGEMDQFMNQYKQYVLDNELQRVTFLNKISDTELIKLYKKALALVFSSSFEGFGLTPVEALMSGCPVVSSDATCLPEVLGENGVIYFKNGSKDGMIQAIKAVVDNHGYYHEKAKEAGQELAKKHSWEKAAKKTLEAYKFAVLD